MAADSPVVERDQHVAAEEIEELRATVGWDRAEGTFSRVLRGSYAYYTVRDDKRLIGFLNVISDGVGDAFLLNLAIHPAFQRRGIGQAIVTRAVHDLSEAGIQCIQVTFAPELEAFYGKCGFDRFAAAIIDNASPERTIRPNLRVDAMLGTRVENREARLQSCARRGAPHAKRFAMTSPSLVESVQRGQLAALSIAGSNARLEVAPHGAHVLAWEPAHTRPVLFMSPQSHYTPGKAIRGGVPLVFPWFGPKAGDATAAQHGFARVREWQVVGARVEADGTACMELALTDDERTHAAWPHAFGARMAARAGRELKLTLDVCNRGAAPFTFEAAFHTYFAVSDVRRIAVHGLAHAEFVERYRGSGRQRQGVAPIAFAGEVDRTYFATTGTCVIDDPGWRRRIVVAKSGSRTTVIWNPGADKARAMADLGDPAWMGFVCVETVCTGDDAVTLAPGSAHMLSATIAVEQE